MPAHPKGMQAMLVPRDACQNGHVVIAVGRMVILVCTDFMGTTVVRVCVVVVIQFMIFGIILLSMWPDGYG